MHVTLFTVQREVGMTRETFKQERVSLAIEPICFHPGMRRFSLAREVMQSVAHVKEHAGFACSSAVSASAARMFRESSSGRKERSNVL